MQVLHVGSSRWITRGFATAVHLRFSTVVLHDFPSRGFSPQVLPEVLSRWFPRGFATTVLHVVCVAGSGVGVALLPRESVWRLPTEIPDRPRTLRARERRDPTRV
jgi:hypothetical protein